MPICSGCVQVEAECPDIVSVLVQNKVDLIEEAKMTRSLLTYCLRGASGARFMPPCLFHSSQEVEDLASSWDRSMLAKQQVKSNSQAAHTKAQTKTVRDLADVE